MLFSSGYYLEHNHDQLLCVQPRTWISILTQELLQVGNCKCPRPCLQGVCMP
jgi:hypothetical protein